MLLQEKGFNCAAFEINSIKTDFAAQIFGNKVFIIISQFGKISNLYTARNQTFNHEDNPMIDESTKIFELSQKFGPQSIEIEGGIRYLLNFITAQEVVICMSLKDPENLQKKDLDEIRQSLSNLKVPIKDQM